MSQTRHMRIIKKLVSSNKAMKAELEEQRKHMRPATEAALEYTLATDAKIIDDLKAISALDSQMCAIYEKALEKKVEDLSLELAATKDVLASTQKTRDDLTAALSGKLLAESA